MKTTKQFITSLVIKILIFMIVSTAVFVILDACAPVITNNVALGQLENDDASYVIWEVYNRARQLITILYYGVVVCCCASWGYSIYNFVKTKNNNIIKED